MRDLQLIGLPVLRDRVRSLIDRSPTQLSETKLVAGYVTQSLTLAGLTPEELQEVAKQAAAMASAIERNRHLMVSQPDVARVA